MREPVRAPVPVQGPEMQREALAAAMQAEPVRALRALGKVPPVAVLPAILRNGFRKSI